MRSTNLLLKTTLLLLQSIILPGSKAQTDMNPINSYSKTGPAYMVSMPDNTSAILSVAEIKAAESYTYFLQLNNAQTAAVIKRKLITGNQGHQINFEQVIGCMDKNIWILTDSLLAYNTATLEPVITETDITTKNPFMLNNFSRRANSYLLDEAAKVMYIGAEDGERYKLYSKELLMKPDNSSSDAAPDDYSYEYAAEYKINDRYEMKFALSNIDTFNNRLYILGSTKETSQALSYFGTGIYNERDETRQLTIIPYKQNGDQIDYKNNKPITGNKKYYKAGFLQKKFTIVAWRGAKGEKIIISGNDRSIKPMMNVALVNKNGEERWMVNTSCPLSAFADYLVNDQYLVIWFSSPAPYTSKFISIDLATGGFGSYTYQP
jgi:hypothetical protein